VLVTADDGNRGGPLFLDIGIGTPERHAQW
jgi:hypothetical protein